MTKKLLLFLAVITATDFANASTNNLDLSDVDIQQKEAIEIFLPELKQRFPNEDWERIEKLPPETQFEYLKGFVAEKAFIEKRDEFISEIKQKASDTNRKFIEENYDDATYFYADVNYELNPERCFYTCTNEQGLQVLEELGKECKNRYKFCIDATPIPENFEKFYMSLQPSFAETEKGICKNNNQNGIATIYYTRDDYENNTRTQYTVTLSCGFDTKEGVFQDSSFHFAESTSDLSAVRNWENQQKSDISNGMLEDIMSNDGTINPDWKSSISPGFKVQGFINSSSVSIQ